LYERGSTLDGYSTGFPDLDALVGGLVGGRLYVLGGGTQTGKSSFVLAMARSFALAGTSVTVIPLAHSQHDVLFRLLGIEAGVDYRRLASGQMSESDWPKISNAVASLADLPMRVVDATTLSGDSLRTQAEAQPNPPAVVLVDDVDLSPIGAKDMADVMKDLKVVARERNLAVVVTAVTPDAFNDSETHRAAIRDRSYGVLADHADVVMILRRPALSNPSQAARERTEVVVAKNRSGPTGRCTFVWMPGLRSGRRQGTRC
jgi:replicative DNA helicase